MLQPHKLTLSHEDLFIERYERLMFWALQLTEKSRDQAEDLVHDAFVQFTFTRPDLATINNLDGYLYGILRNLGLLQMRRANRSVLRPLSIVEYDSAEIGIRAMGLQAQLRVQDELRMVCQYVCARKHTSKVGSALILRFFHGYFTGEIAQVMQISRRAVNERLRIARAEAKLFLASPNSLSFLKETSPATVEQPGVVRTMDELLHELRRAIFQARRGDCLSRTRLAELYGTKEAETIDNDSLGHLVSCHLCLDEVNKVLGLPLLNERYPTDMLGPDKPKGGSGGGPFSKTPSKDAIAKCRHRTNEVFDHRPQELCILVNGDIYIWHKINSALSEQSISLNDTETVDLVEVTSEQGMRLMFLAPESQPAGPVKHSARIELSDDRALELALDHSGLCPILHVAYHDPTFDSAEAGVESRSAIEVQSPKSKVQSPLAGNQGRWRTVRQHLPDFRLWTFDFGLFLRPATVTALLALILIGVVLFVGRQRTPAPLTSASNLLAQSAAAEAAVAARTDQVLHRTINFEEKDASDEVIARRKIEVWHSAERGVTARRIYDEQSRLVAGDWRTADGVETLFAHGRKPQIQSSPDKRGSIELNFGNVWQQDLTAQNFAALVKNAGTLKLDESANTYVLTYQSDSVDGLRQATLMLSRSDLNATEQTLIVRQGNEERTYHYLETSFERRPTSAVAPAVFEPEPALLGDDTGTRRSGDTGTISASPPPPISASLVTATADLEVEVLRLLNQAGADLGEQVSVSRRQDGLLHITGLVETDTRKSEIAHALNPILSNPAVRYEIQTVAEVMARQQREKNGASQPTTVEGVEIRADTFAAFSDLRARLSDVEARAFASLMINRSHTAMRHAGALKRLLNQFSREDLRTLAPEARSKWLSLIRGHARAFQGETRLMRQQLQPIFFPSASPGDIQGEAVIGDDDSLARAVERLFDLGTSNERVISSAFATSSSAARTTAIHSEQFWQSLRSSEALAASIQNAH